MISPASSIVVDWLLLLVTYLICGVRLYVVYSRARSSRKLRRRCDTEIILCTVLAIGTANVCVDTWRNYKLIQFQRRAGSGGVDDEDRREMDIFQMKVFLSPSCLTRYMYTQRGDERKRMKRIMKRNRKE
jgi:hypothetical protein